MGETAIKTENIGKKYFVGQRKSRDIRNSFSNFLMKIKGNWIYQDKEFWALRDVSFEVKRGEAIGIIGKNGAGKSTLLKIMSRITEPTIGRFEAHGMISSLLEVGTGMHPELTGRENVYLNGTILGMKRNQVKAKFDEILAFSGVEEFIDMPIKRYSSGMRVRLAFSVAAHLEPDILIIDEVLAVGDQEFQQKCLGKMNDVTKKSGRTVLFVSHNMQAIQNLCEKTIYLEDGKVAEIGETQKVISTYFHDIPFRKPVVTNLSTNSGDFLLERVEVKTEKIGFNEDIILYIDIKSSVINRKLLIRIGICNSLSNRLVTAEREIRISCRRHSYQVRLKNHYLASGNYELDFFLALNREPIYFSRNLLQFSINVGKADILMLEKNDLHGVILPSEITEVRSYDYHQ